MFYNIYFWSLDFNLFFFFFNADDLTRQDFSRVLEVSQNLIESVSAQNGCGEGTGSSSQKEIFMILNILLLERHFLS